MLHIRSCRDHVWHANISDTAQKCYSARNGRNQYINYMNIFGNRKNAAAMIWVLQHFQNLIVLLFISYEIR